jgi:hypothetical protein
MSKNTTPFPHLKHIDFQPKEPVKRRSAPVPNTAEQGEPTMEFKEFSRGVRRKIASQGSLGVLTLVFIALVMALYITVPIALCYLIVGIIGAILGTALSIPVILAASYLLTSLAICSLLIPLLPAATAALPTALVALVAIAVTAVAMTIIDFLVNIPIRWEAMRNRLDNTKHDPHYTSWNALIWYSLERSRDGILYFMVPAVLIALACGLPPVAASLHFASGILPGLISWSAISIGCIAKSIHQVSYATANVTIALDHDSYFYDKYEPVSDSDEVEKRTLLIPGILFLLAIALIVVTFIAGAILPVVWSLFCALVLTALAIFSSAYLLLPVIYAIAANGICGLVLPLLPATTTLLGSLATLSTGLAITFAVIMILDIIIDHCVKLYFMPGAPSDELAKFSVTNTGWTLMLVALPAAAICWSCGLPTLLVGSGILWSIMPMSTISIVCLTSAFMSKNSIVLATSTYATEKKTCWYYHTVKERRWAEHNKEKPKRIVRSTFLTKDEQAEHKIYGGGAAKTGF